MSSRLGAFTLALLTLGGCQHPRGEQKAAGKPSALADAGGSGLGTTLASATQTLPEDPIAGERAVAEWRKHQQEEERERKANYDRRRMADHRAVVTFLRGARQSYDTAKTPDAVLRAQKALPAAIANARARIEKIDHWRVSSNLLGDYDALLASLADTYPAACVSALAGDRAAFDAERAAVDARFRKIDEWLEYANEAEEE